MHDDPGWAIDWKMIPLAFEPQMAVRRMWSTKRNLLRDQDALSVRGCAESLVAALRQPRTYAPNR